MTDTATPTAGRELDALIAERVMGWRREGKGWFTSPSHEKGGSDWEGKGEHDVLIGPGGEKVWLCPCGTNFLVQNDDHELPAYSTDIAAVWPVWEWYVKHPDTGEMNLAPVLRRLDKSDGLVIASWAIQEYRRTDDWYYENMTVLEAETAPLAICRAALAVVAESP